MQRWYSIDASQIDFGQAEVWLLPQTKRHSAILKHLRCSHIIVAINKMDLLNFDENKFNTVVRAYKNWRHSWIYKMSNLCLFLPQMVIISSIRAKNTPWYQGGTLLEILESLPVGKRF